MEFNKVITKRRSIRNFQSKKIDDSLIREIINSAILAPSAHNYQPWHYYILSGAKKTELILLISNFITKTSELTLNQKIMRKNIEFIKQAPIVILCYMNVENCKDEDILSMGASIENLILSAENNNLGTLWNGVIIDFEKIINKHFKIINQKLVSAVILGYKNEAPECRPRKKIEEISTFL